MAQEFEIPEEAKFEKSRTSLLAKYEKRLWDEIGVQTGQIWYRGQKSARWELKSGAVQRIAETKATAQDLIDYHKDLIRSARLLGWDRVSGGGKLSDPELLAILQHHGTATCLLDFTADFRIALWFACQEVGDLEFVGKCGKESKHGVDEKARATYEDGKVFVVPINPGYESVKFLEVRPDELEEPIGYFLDPDRLRKTEPTFPEEKILESIKQTVREVVREEFRHSRNLEELLIDMSKVQGKPEHEKNLTFWYWQPEALMGRILSQASRFIFGPNDFSELDEVSYGSICKEILVRKEDKEELLEELKSRHGLIPETIFSDIHGDRKSVV